METLWNKFDLQRPTALTCKVSSQKIDTKKFPTIIDKIIKDLESQEMLHFEAALLGRLIYRMKCKFRSDKGLKCMEKTNRALLNYLKLCLENDYIYLKECINLNTLSNYVVLPSKQIIEYTLVRTQSFAKLMCRVESVSQEAAFFLKSRIDIGQSWEVSLIAFSVMSRICILSRNLIKKSCDWYNSLYKLTRSLKTTGVEWLPKNYSLPVDLKCWLKLPWIDEPLPSIPTHEEIKQNIFNLIKPTDDDSENEMYFETEDVPVTPKLSTSSKKCKMSEKSAVSKTKSTKSPQKQTSLTLGLTDVGQRISREEFDSIVKKEIKEKELKKDCQVLESNEDKLIKKRKNETKETKARKKLKYKTQPDESPLDKGKPILTPDKLKSECDLISFLDAKSYPGMDKMEWKLLKKNVRKFLVDINNSSESVSKKKKLKMIIKKIQEWTSS